jgi:hypothetical protein
MSEASYPSVVVYGDWETVQDCQAKVHARAARRGLRIVDWYYDPQGLRDIHDPCQADGVVTALGRCAREHANPYVPFLSDVPSEARWRQLGKFLHVRGLRLLLEDDEYRWDEPIDIIDLALRHELEAAAKLAAAVTAIGAVPAVEAFVEQIVGDASSGRKGRS